MLSETGLISAKAILRLQGTPRLSASDTGDSIPAIYATNWRHYIEASTGKYHWATDIYKIVKRPPGKYDNKSERR